MRAHRRTGRRLGREVAELSRAVTNPTAARELTRQVLEDLDGDSYPDQAGIAMAVARHCADDAQRSALAAYLHLCRDVSLDAVGRVFTLDGAAARRLVERGSGTAPVTAGDECRGWALVAPRPGRTAPERHAGAGHLALCRHCRNKLRVHAVLEQRVAAAGSVTFGASVTAAVGRAFAGSHVVGSAVGALSAPIVALSTAAALTAAVGAVAVSSHHGSTRSPVGVVRQRDGAPGGVRTTPAAASRTLPSGPASENPAARVPVTPPPGLSPSKWLLPLPGATDVPLPAVSAPALPVPTVSVSVAPLPLPTPSVSVPVSVPPLPLPLP